MEMNRLEIRKYITVDRYEKRHFLTLTLVTLLPMFVFFYIVYFANIEDANRVFDLRDTVAMTILMIICAGLTEFGIRHDKIKIASSITSFIMSFGIIPEVVSAGQSGVYTTIWFAAGVLYIVILQEGFIKWFLLIVEAIMAAVLHLYLFESNSGKTQEEFVQYVSAYLLLVMISVMIIVMVDYEIKLLKRVNERAIEQNKEIENLNRAQNRFFSSMSHEIRTPINTIIGLNEMILREDVSDEVAEDANNIRSASKILLSLINDILDMSKIESGKMEVVKAAYNAGDMLSEIVNMIWIKASEKGLQFKIDIDPALPAELYSDEVRIKQILINLLNNAIKYTSEGSVSLSIRCEREKEGIAKVIYSVEDTGMGIRKESIPHLFDAFRREEEEKNRYIEGTGLGLSIVKQLVDILGGEITVDSVYTKGSTFTVTIEQEVANEEALGDFNPGKIKKNEKTDYHQRFEAPEAKVLIVDDNSANLLVAEKLLRDTKVKVIKAESGREALELTAQNQFSAIFMDHLMPDMDGIETLHAIREQVGGLCKNTPVVALTANAGSKDQALYRKEGFDGYVLKPVEGALLEEALLSVLPKDLVSIKSGEKVEYQSFGVIGRAKRKVPIVITTDSVSDLPRELVNSLKIPVFPYRVYMKGAIFDDGPEAAGDVIVRYLEDKMLTAKSEAPEVEDYERFFSEQLSGAQHVIHIALGKRSSKGYDHASEAAGAFYNVEVVDSGHLSSGMGLLVLYAKDLIDSGMTDVTEIVKELEIMKKYIRTSFIVDSSEYLYRGGRLSERLYRIFNALLLHPVLVMKNSKITVGRIIVGTTEKARRTYIRSTLRKKHDIDTSVLFITYVGMSRPEIEGVRDEVLKIVPFEKVCLQKASPAISINSGPGTFGLLFKLKKG